MIKPSSGRPSDVNNPTDDSDSDDENEELE